MPRPGPRPYECVRRAWHSDRHQAMRGSIIRQVFRVVNEVHSAATKKNQEWQEKLPVVVLKAEEIMYSKANSEVEYMNLDTLWDRVNDAINTIIRRDESSETAGLLPPCIEAALNLGCSPVRASRSQRHSNLRTYLTPRTQEPASASTRTSENTSDDRRAPCHPSNQLNFSRAITPNFPTLVPESNNQVNQNHILSSPQNFSFAREHVPIVHSNLSAMNTNLPLNLGSSYPLYCGSCYQTKENELGSCSPEDAQAKKTILLGRPVITSTAESSVEQNLFFGGNTGNASSRSTLENVMDIHNKLPETECDLSLRLGLHSELCIRSEKSLAFGIEDVGTSGSQERRKLSDQSIQVNQEFCFFPNEKCS